MAQELANWTEKKEGDLLVRTLSDERGIVQEEKICYEVWRMGIEKPIRISIEQYDKLKRMLENPNIRFVEIKDNLVAVHQITSIDKSKQVFSRGY